MNSRSKFILLFIIVFFFIGILPCYAEWGSWDKPETNSNKQEELSTSTPKIIGLSVIRFYQIFISPLLREHKCNFTPSCSRYGYQAIEEYGSIKGTIMTFERISRCHPWAWKEKYEVKDRRLYDPPANNQWWKQ